MSLPPHIATVSLSALLELMQLRIREKLFGSNEIKAAYTMYTVLAMLSARKTYTSLRFFLYYGFKPSIQAFRGLFTKLIDKVRNITASAKEKTSAHKTKAAPQASKREALCTPLMLAIAVRVIFMAWKYMRKVDCSVIPGCGTTPELLMEGPFNPPARLRSPRLV